MKRAYAAGVALAVLSACSPQAEAPFRPPATSISYAFNPSLVAKPANVEFGLGGLISPSIAIRLKAGAPLSSSLVVTVADPTEVGVSVVRARLHVAKAIFYPISSGTNGGSTVVRFTDRDNARATVSVAVSQQLCGRPDNVEHADLIYPPVRSSAPRTIGALYFAVYSAFAITTAPVNLHLIVGKHGTLEGSQLARASPPPGAVIPAPPGGSAVTTYFRGSIPRLPPGVTIRTQVYDDNCQLPVLAGEFRTDN